MGTSHVFDVFWSLYDYQERKLWEHYLVSFNGNRHLTLHVFKHEEMKGSLFGLSLYDDFLLKYYTYMNHHLDLEVFLRIQQF